MFVSPRFMAAFTLVAVIAGSLPTDVNAKQRQTKPFSMKGTATWDNLLNAFDPAVGASFDNGVGNATHLGKFNASATMFATSAPDAQGNVGVEGYVTFVAANGDKLYADFIDGNINIVSGVGEAEYKFTGGTGRFINASGSGYVLAHFATEGGQRLEDVPMTVVWFGSIKY